MKTKNGNIFNFIHHWKRWRKRRLEKPLNELNQRYHIANVIMDSETTTAYDTHRSNEN